MLSLQDIIQKTKQKTPFTTKSGVFNFITLLFTISNIYFAKSPFSLLLYLLGLAQSFSRLPVNLLKKTA